MGNIVIANMQAHLTLDSRQFEEGLAQAEARLKQLEQRISNLPGEQRSNVGQTGDPEQQAREKRRSEDMAAASQAMQLQDRVRAGAVSNNALMISSAQTVSAAYRQMADDSVKFLDPLLAKMRTLREETNQLVRDMGKITGQVAERAPQTPLLQAPQQQPTQAAQQYVQRPGPQGVMGAIGEQVPVPPPPPRTPVPPQILALPAAGESSYRGRPDIQRVPGGGRISTEEAVAMMGPEARALWEASQVAPIQGRPLRGAAVAVAPMPAKAPIVRSTTGYPAGFRPSGEVMAGDFCSYAGCG